MGAWGQRGACMGGAHGRAQELDNAQKTCACTGGMHVHCILKAQVCVHALITRSGKG